ncbi:hypothetical protein NBRC110019_17100 [Neptunitalea chrysea]|uniref:HMA domain-containing protein n=2 Tax=Neptunitalea chrysea TaxID=1647581 RepID=A0A9W6ETW4_9FLAO|nr:hypothetical protein NBRC110019_17100 [Neptunitalea chrysea]
MLLLSVSFTSCNSQTKEVTAAKETKVLAANFETTEFNIDGMMCPTGCAANIEKKLNTLEGVKHAKVDFENKKAEVSFDSTKLSLEAIATTVTTIGDGHMYKVYNMAKTEKTAKGGCTEKCSAEKKANCSEEKKANCTPEMKQGCCAKKM